MSLTCIPWRSSMARLSAVMLRTACRKTSLPCMARKKSSGRASPFFTSMAEPPPMTIRSCIEPSAQQTESRTLHKQPVPAPRRTTAPAPSPNRTQVLRSEKSILRLSASAPMSSTTASGRNAKAERASSRPYRNPEHAALKSMHMTCAPCPSLLAERPRRPATRHAVLGQK